MMRPITLKAGRTLTWSVDVTGEPAPTIEWIWRDEIALVKTERIVIDNNTPNHTVFTYAEVMRGDRGKYMLRLVITTL